MYIHAKTYDDALREAHRLRARAMADLWRRLRDALSLHVPKLFPSEF